MSDAEPESGDFEFANAVREAASALAAAHLELFKNAGGSSKRLIDYILSDHPLTRVDRDLLVEFLSGGFRLRPGRKARSKSENDQRREIYEGYKSLMEGMRDSISGRPAAQIAVDILCAKYPRLTPIQIEQIVRHRPMRVSQSSVFRRKKTPG
ncbi:hypothetical protein MKK68_20020 [Methylobacterium sp. E-016]|uniref:hypothetical protein n=1 Tax=Methylobacterium sp. E-016 TaxID=2836556 RepID=UPI001FBABAFE|nr:hypothetical protein [Methylobacterium sp. E-016]MCJ2077901.1 hypothetical protein [Methylobacterium sp. E-016]